MPSKYNEESFENILLAKMQKAAFEKQQDEITRTMKRFYPDLAGIKLLAKTMKWNEYETPIIGIEGMDQVQYNIAGLAIKPHDQDQLEKIQNMVNALNGLAEGKKLSFEAQSDDDFYKELSKAWKGVSKLSMSNLTIDEQAMVYKFSKGIEAYNTINQQGEKTKDREPLSPKSVKQAARITSDKITKELHEELLPDTSYSYRTKTAGILVGKRIPDRTSLDKQDLDYSRQFVQGMTSLVMRACLGKKKKNGEITLKGVKATPEQAQEIKLIVKAYCDALEWNGFINLEDANINYRLFSKTPSQISDDFNSSRRQFGQKVIMRAGGIVNHQGYTEEILKSVMDPKMQAAAVQQAKATSLKDILYHRGRLVHEKQIKAEALPDSELEGIKKYFNGAMNFGVSKFLTPEINADDRSLLRKHGAKADKDRISSLARKNTHNFTEVKEELGKKKANQAWIMSAFSLMKIDGVDFEDLYSDAINSVLEKIEEHNGNPEKFLKSIKREDEKAIVDFIRFANLSVSNINLLAADRPTEESFKISCIQFIEPTSDLLRKHIPGLMKEMVALFPEDNIKASQKAEVDEWKAAHGEIALQLDGFRLDCIAREQLRADRPIPIEERAEDIEIRTFQRFMKEGNQDQLTLLKLYLIEYIYEHTNIKITKELDSLSLEDMQSLRDAISTQVAKEKKLGIEYVREEIQNLSSSQTEAVSEAELEVPVVDRDRLNTESDLEAAFAKEDVLIDPKTGEPLYAEIDEGLETASDAKEVELSINKKFPQKAATAIATAFKEVSTAKSNADKVKALKKIKTKNLDGLVKYFRNESEYGKALVGLKKAIKSGKDEQIKQAYGQVSKLTVASAQNFNNSLASINKGDVDKLRRFQELATDIEILAIALGGPKDSDAKKLLWLSNAAQTNNSNNAVSAYDALWEATDERKNVGGTYGVHGGEILGHIIKIANSGGEPKTVLKEDEAPRVEEQKDSDNSPGRRALRAVAFAAKPYLASVPKPLNGSDSFDKEVAKVLTHSPFKDADVIQNFGIQNFGKSSGNRDYIEKKDEIKELVEAFEGVLELETDVIYQSAVMAIARRSLNVTVAFAEELLQRGYGFTKDEATSKVEQLLEEGKLNSFMDKLVGYKGEITVEKINAIEPEDDFELELSVGLEVDDGEEDDVVFTKSVSEIPLILKPDGKTVDEEGLAKVKEAHRILTAIKEKNVLDMKYDKNSIMKIFSLAKNVLDGYPTQGFNATTFSNAILAAGDHLYRGKRVDASNVMFRDGVETLAAAIDALDKSIQSTQRLADPKADNSVISADMTSSVAKGKRVSKPQTRNTGSRLGKLGGFSDVLDGLQAQIPVSKGRYAEILKEAAAIEGKNETDAKQLYLEQYLIHRGGYDANQANRIITEIIASELDGKLIDSLRALKIDAGDKTKSGEVAKAVKGVLMVNHSASIKQGGASKAAERILSEDQNLEAALQAAQRKLDAKKLKGHATKAVGEVSEESKLTKLTMLKFEELRNQLPVSDKRWNFIISQYKGDNSAENTTKFYLQNYLESKGGYTADSASDNLNKIAKDSKGSPYASLISNLKLLKLDANAKPEGSKGNLNNAQQVKSIVRSELSAKGMQPTASKWTRPDSNASARPTK